MADFTFSDVMITFADQFQTLAIYDKAKKSFTSFMLKDRKSATSKPVTYKLSVAANKLSVVQDTAPANMNPHDFLVPKAASDVWQVNNSIIVGMGDIRDGINVSITEYDLSVDDIFITAETMFRLRMKAVKRPTKKKPKRKQKPGRKK